jgi:hypothetical protein
MSCHSVSKISGIGPVTQRTLEGKNVHTVGDLACLSPNQYSINNLTLFISRAKQYIEDREVCKKEEEPSIVVIGLEDTEEKQDTADPDAVKLETEESDHENQEAIKILIEDHTWWECKVLIPYKSKAGCELKEAIIYELSLEPFNRVAFICSWVTGEDNSKERLCTMTYSPQLILYFNTGADLPLLKISMNQADWENLDNKYTVENVLWETNLIHNFNNKH